MFLTNGWPMIVTAFLLFLLIGSAGGFLSGLFGLGGGVVIVPALMWVFKYIPMLHIPEEHYMQFAAGTSLSSMVVTAAVATYCHQRYQNVIWSTWIKLLPGICFGTIFGGWIASILDTSILAIIFGIQLLFVALYIFLSARQKRSHTKLLVIPLAVYILVGAMVGVIAGMLGVGGGVFIIPFLIMLRLPMTKIAGTSAALVLPLAITGTCTFIAAGNSQLVPIDYSVGYIYLPAFICVTVASTLFAILGASLSRYVNQMRLKKGFAILLVIIALQLFNY